MRANRTSAVLPIGPRQRQCGRTTSEHPVLRLHFHAMVPARRERGTALVFALVMLLLLTILGITAITTSSLQEKMAGNMRDQYMAQQAGESILRDGQAWVFNQQTRPTPTCPPAATATGRIWDSSCLPTSASSPTASWWLTADDTWWTANGYTSTVATNYVLQEPRYVVERIQQVPLDPSSGKKIYRYYYRTTGWSVGASDYSRGILQDIFSKRSDTYPIQ